MGNCQQGEGKEILFVKSSRLIASNGPEYQSFPLRTAVLVEHETSELESCLNEVPWFLQRSFYLSCSPGFKGASWKSHPYTGLRTDGPHPPRKILFLILAAPHFLILRYTIFPKDASLPCGHTTCLFRHGRRPNHHRPRELVTSFRFSYREALGSA